MASFNTSNHRFPIWSSARRFISRWEAAVENARQGVNWSVTFVGSAKQIPEKLRDEGFPLPLEGAWLYEALEQSNLEQVTLLYALISNGTMPVGAAPVFVMDVPMERVCPEKLLTTLRTIARIVPSILYQRTLFVGSPGAAQGAVGVLPGTNRRAALFALQCALERKARNLNAELLIWRDIPESLSKDLDWLTGRCRLFRTVSLPGTLVTFSSQSKSDYFSQLKGSQRSAFRRKLKKSGAAVDVSVEVLQNPAPELLEEMFALFRQTYLKAKIKFEELNRTWFRKIAERPETHFIALRERKTGDMVAATACFDRFPMLVARHVGFNYDKPKSWMLYFRTWDALVDWALSKGYTSILSGQTSYLAKIEVGHDLMPLFNYIWHRNAVMHLIYKTIAQGLDWAKLDEGLAAFLRAHPDADVKEPRCSGRIIERG